ncbi:hypothetical protein AB205_0057030 [Aquarana catesbeiana]|uniref:UGGT thioredoxin-like domain-containing protein n=1 Tax=Aquarana catesbeiana TaxID=8400 RepID=A0A2G9PU45_AQUCT|nr:hypothetical protein AB205_0057030 [Aquarana catesbeiana]
MEHKRKKQHNVLTRSMMIGESSVIERPRPYLYKGDHVFPTLTKTAPVVILYAEVGTKAFATFHKTLIEKAESGEITYVLRHYIQTPSSRKINLSGYGVELAIKDTEYKAMDDTQAAVTNSTTSSYEGIDEDVQGFYFDKLIQMYPDLKNNLVEFRKHLIESTNEMLPLKVWELQGTFFLIFSNITGHLTSFYILTLLCCYLPNLKLPCKVTYQLLSLCLLAVHYIFYTVPSFTMHQRELTAL